MINKKINWLKYDLHGDRNRERGWGLGHGERNRETSIVPKAPRERESIVPYNQKGKIVEFIGTIHRTAKTIPFTTYSEGTHWIFLELHTGEERNI